MQASAEAGASSGRCRSTRPARRRHGASSGRHCRVCRFRRACCTTASRWRASSPPTLCMRSGTLAAWHVPAAVAAGIPEIWLYLRGDGADPRDRLQGLRHRARLDASATSLACPRRRWTRSAAAACRSWQGLSAGQWGCHLSRSRLGNWKVPGKAVWFALRIPPAVLPDHSAAPLQPGLAHGRAGVHARRPRPRQYRPRRHGRHLRAVDQPPPDCMAAWQHGVLARAVGRVPAGWTSPTSSMSPSRSSAPTRRRPQADGPARASSGRCERGPR